VTHVSTATSTSRLRSSTVPERGLAKDPELAGEVRVHFVIERDGSVSDARGATESDPLVDGEVPVPGRKSSLPDADVITCIVHEFEELSFPTPKDGKITVVYPIIFKPHN